MRGLGIGMLRAGIATAALALGGMSGGGYRSSNERPQSSSNSKRLRKPVAAYSLTPISEFKPTNSPGADFDRGDVRRMMREHGLMKFQREAPAPRKMRERTF